MKIGIDISQLAFSDTGVANYLYHLITEMVAQDTTNTYILFFSSLRQSVPHEINNLLQSDKSGRLQLKRYRIPPALLEFMWNRIHLLPIEQLLGDVDVFITSDWTEPPARSAKKMTILYDLIVYTHPEETDKAIVDVQKRKLSWVKKESSHIFCISEATREDAEKILGIDKSRTSVLYPGITI